MAFIENPEPPGGSWNPQQTLHFIVVASHPRGQLEAVCQWKFKEENPGPLRAYVKHNLKRRHLKMLVSFGGVALGRIGEREGGKKRRALEKQIGLG